MKKLLIHTEYFCILNLLAMLFLVKFYQQGSMMFWAMLIFLDGAELLLKIDEQKLTQALFDSEWKVETQRIKIYLVGVLVFLVYILLTQPISLFLIILINEAISSGLNYLSAKYLWKEDGIAG